MGERGSRGGMGIGKAEYWARGAEQELERLDEAFLSVGDHVNTQKEAAQKWIRRQRIRMEVCERVRPCCARQYLRSALCWWCRWWRKVVGGFHANSVRLVVNVAMSGCRQG